jgi:hypothetical protein
MRPECLLERLSLCWRGLSDGIRQAFPKVKAVQVTPDQNELAHPGNVRIGLLGWVVKHVKNLSDALDEPLPPIMGEKAAFYSVDVIRRAV